MGKLRDTRAKCPETRLPRLEAGHQDQLSTSPTCVKIVNRRLSPGIATKLPVCPYIGERQRVHDKNNPLMMCSVKWAARYTLVGAGHMQYGKIAGAIEVRYIHPARRRGCRRGSAPCVGARVRRWQRSLSGTATDKGEHSDKKTYPQDGLHKRSLSSPGCESAGWLHAGPQRGVPR